MEERGAQVGAPHRNSPIAPLPRPARGELFIGAPVPWSWLQHAGSLPGAALHVGNYLWREAARRKNACVALSLSAVARAFGISRATAGRALVALERAGLVQVERRRGAKALVTLRAAPSPAPFADAEIGVESRRDE